MVYIFKISGKKLAYDSTSGAFVALTALANKMMGALTAPLAPVCPTSLRYELAKYDSEDVSETYEMLYELQEKGVLFCEKSDKARIMTEGEYSAESSDEIKEALLKAKADGKTNAEVIGSGELANEAEKLISQIFG